MSYLARLKEAEAKLIARRAIELPCETNEQTKKLPDGSPRHVAGALPLLEMTLERFQCAEAWLQIRVPWLDVTLWIVPTDRDAAQLMARSVHRGRIWTAAELIQLMAIANRLPNTAKTITHAKLELNGEITEVQGRGL